MTHRKFWLLGATVAAGLGLGGTASAAEVPVLNVGGVADGGGGSLKVTVKFDGRQQPRRPVRMDQDPFCVAAHADSRPLSEQYIFGDNDTLQNVLVYVSKGLEGKTFDKPSTPAKMDQHDCIYIPHVMGMVVGEIEIHNSDNTLHNVKMDSSNNGSFNEGMPTAGMVLKKSFNRPELGIKFACNVHPWMNAYLHVFEHPFFAVTQQDGTITLNGLPAGEYEISVRHEFDRFTPVEKSVTVKIEEGAEATAEFTYRPPA
jgi:hypothetical protein